MLMVDAKPQTLHGIDYRKINNPENFSSSFGIKEVDIMLWQELKMRTINLQRSCNLLFSIYGQMVCTEGIFKKCIIHKV